MWYILYIIYEIMIIYINNELNTNYHNHCDEQNTWSDTQDNIYHQNYSIAANLNQIISPGIFSEWKHS